MSNAKNLKKRHMLIEQYSAVDMGGKVFVAVTLTTKLIEWIGHVEFNDVLTGIMSIAGLVYLILKIQGQILDNRAKRKEEKDA